MPRLTTRKTAYLVLANLVGRGEHAVYSRQDDAEDYAAILVELGYHVRVIRTNYFDTEES